MKIRNSIKQRGSAPFLERRPTVIEMVIVNDAGGLLQAEITKAFLESNGIPVMLSQESVGATYGLALGPLGNVAIMVPAERKDEALALLQAMEKGDFEDISPEDMMDIPDEDEEA